MKRRIYVACIIVCGIGGLVKAGFQDDSVKHKGYLAHLLWGLVLGVFAGAIVAEIAMPSSDD